MALDLFCGPSVSLYQTLERRNADRQEKPSWKHTGARTVGTPGDGARRFMI
jgi:hypothetical protein